MRALEPEVVDVVWAAIEPLIPPAPKTHPLGCHRPRVADRLCFWGMLVRLVTGCSWVSVEALLENQVSDTTLRARRDEWVGAGVFDQLRATPACLRPGHRPGSHRGRPRGSLHKAPCGGEGTGKNPTDRAKLGWKWSIATDAHGIPIGWAIDGANRNDVKLLAPTLEDVDRVGTTRDIETLHLDRGYDYPQSGRTRRRGLDDFKFTTQKARGRQASEAPDTTRPALGGRRHQLVAQQLRTTPSKHGPPDPAPPCSALPGRRPD